MDPEATLCLTESTQRSGIVIHSRMAVPVTFQSKKLVVLAQVTRTGEAHYTEEHLTIPETLASQAAIVFQKTHGTNFRHRRSTAS